MRIENPHYRYGWQRRVLTLYARASEPEHTMDHRWRFTHPDAE
jgi:hypothetical protein